MVDAGVSFWITLGGGVVFASVLCLELRSVLRLRREGVRTEGTVVDNVEKASKRKRRWVPVIAFDDTEGYPVEFVPRAQTGRTMPLGRTVRVIYLHERPQAARIDRWADLWFGVTILAAFLIGVTVAAIDLGTQVTAAGGM